MQESQIQDDTMPEWGSPEFEVIAKRAAKLSLPQLVKLVVDVGRVAYGNKQTLLRTATKDELIDVLDEAQSKNAVLDYLKNWELKDEQKSC